MFRFMLSMVLAAFLALPTITHAGSEAAGDPILPVAQINAFSDKVQQDLAARGAYVAIVARTGRDPSSLPKGIRYTHLGYWVYSQLTDANGNTSFGYRVYNLYQEAGNDSRSRLVQDNPADFFAGAHRLEAGIIIPDKRLQKKLLQVIASPTYARLHNPNYAVLANPLNSRFQNCTEHALEVMMASIYGTDDKARIKANINAYFKPQRVEISGLKRFFAPAASGALTTSDHGSKVATATFGSIARFMKDNKLAETVYRMTPGGTYSY